MQTNATANRVGLRLRDQVAAEQPSPPAGATPAAFGIGVIDRGDHRLEFAEQRGGRQLQQAGGDRVQVDCGQEVGAQAAHGVAATRSGWLS